MRNNANPNADGHPKSDGRTYTFAYSDTDGNIHTVSGTYVDTVISLHDADAGLLTFTIATRDPKFITEPGGG